LGGRELKIAKFLVISILMFAASTLAITETVMPTIQRVFDTERLENADMLLLKNGDRLTGTVMNESFSIRTSYTYMEIESKYIAGIDMEGGANNTGLIITVNNNRFSGVLDSSFINFKLMDGPELDISSDKVVRIIFKQNPQETNGMKSIQFTHLKNGDYFSGEIIAHNVELSTIYAIVLLDLAKIESLTFVGDTNILTTVKMVNGDTLQGILQTDDLEFKLDVGLVIRVDQRWIDRVFFNEGYIPDSMPSVINDLASAGNRSTVLVNGGTFLMGDTWGDGNNLEKPVHEVDFEYSYYMGKFEVSFEEYDAFCEATRRVKPDDLGWGRDNRPVINVTWWDAIDYCNWLSEEEELPKAYDNLGKLLDKHGDITSDPSKVVGYRLPTEAEWEYAARGGEVSEGYRYSGSNYLDEVAWYDRNSGLMTQEVGTKAPNELGLYDMTGNVMEWCSEWWYDYAEAKRTNTAHSVPNFLFPWVLFRGGGWGFSEEYLSVSQRDGSSPDSAFKDLGFRICRTAP